MAEAYRLEAQVGFLLRRANQRHTAIFAARMPHGLTPTQFAALVQLEAEGQTSQNRLGRLTAMDAATIKGVVDRLRAQGLVAVAQDPEDRRRSVLALTERGAQVIATARRAAPRITEETLAPLSEPEARVLLDLLGRIAD